MACKKLFNEALLPVTPRVDRRFLKLWSKAVAGAALAGVAVVAAEAKDDPVPESALDADDAVCAIKAFNSAASWASPPPSW